MKNYRYFNAALFLRVFLLVALATGQSGTTIHAFAVGAPSTINIPSNLLSCTDPLGCITIGSGAKVHIAYALAMSGASSALGIDSHNGVEIAIDDSGGKILGHDIQFDGYDEGCSASGGTVAGIALAADPTIVAVIGTSCSTAARTAMPLLYASGMVMVSPSNTAPDLTDLTSPNHYPGYFRTSWSDKLQGAPAADYAYNILGVRKAATIQDGGLYATMLQQAFADAFTALGGTITLQTSITVGQTDMSSELTAIASGSPDLVYFPVFMPEGGYLITQARGTLGLGTAYLMGSDGLYTPAVASVTSVEGFLVTSPDFDHFSPAYKSSFLPAYKSKFGYDPTSLYHAQAYDAFMLIKAAIEKVAVVDLDGTLHIGRQALRDALYATSGFAGLTGTLTCSPTGECGDPHTAVYRYHNGQYPPEKIWSDFVWKIFLPLVKR